MQFISAFLFGVSANIDTILLGFSYGMKKQRIPFTINILISMITFFGTLLSITLGLRIAACFPVAYAKLAGSVLLILLGGYYIIKYIVSALHRPIDTTSQELLEKAELSKKEAIVLGLALSVNNAGLGIGASFAGLNLWLPSIFTFVLCVLFLIWGVHLGIKYCPKRLSRWAEPVSGMIIIVLGLYTFVS